MATNTTTPITNPNSTTLHTATEKTTTTMMTTHISHHTYHITATPTAPGTSNSPHVCFLEEEYLSPKVVDEYTRPVGWFYEHLISRTGRVVGESTVRLWSGLCRTTAFEARERRGVGEECEMAVGNISCCGRTYWIQLMALWSWK
ncbi:hypothetical protein GMDG_02765 [Pseudogymnoascus destructans 20631-21]|uniref:Uncharacterized protein n=1 Tax=Pseudogymnoascus destructans (strain ATCC MYA-4855 / 20631-21) TaxID=658429 RepID=L8G5D2_PSED2|nr:hypothetical protein GMDG_02765 [Pseudogymnoascus destructans 20631-21]